MVYIPYMEHPAAAFKIRTNDPAPALTRGLALLRCLERDGAQSLQRLADVSGWPKTSVHRLLQSLSASGFVVREPDNGWYRATVRLAPLAPVQQQLRDLAAPLMRDLASTLEHTIELHAFASGRLSMIDRCEPEDAVVAVRARVGFEREFDELDALTQAVLAWGIFKVDWPTVRTWVWNDGKRKPISQTKRAQVIAKVRQRGAAIDLAINPHGVSRIAVPILGRNRQLLGVLAVARLCLASQTLDDRAAKALLQAAERLSAPCAMLDGSFS